MSDKGSPNDRPKAKARVHLLDLSTYPAESGNLLGSFNDAAVPIITLDKQTVNAGAAQAARDTAQTLQQLRLSGQSSDEFASLSATQVAQCDEAALGCVGTRRSNGTWTTKYERYCDSRTPPVSSCLVYTSVLTRFEF